MTNISRYRPEDQRAVDEMYHEVFGAAATESFRQRWEWLYRRNPNLPDGAPLIWLAREGERVIGQYATMPVRLTVRGAEIDAAWGMDVMVHPAQQRKGLGRLLFEVWDRNVGAAIGLGLTDASHALFQKLQWPDLGRVPQLAKPLSARVLAAWGEGNGLVSYGLIRLRHVAARLRPAARGVAAITRFDERFTRLWERLAPCFGFAVRRDAAYLNWRFVESPRLRYQVAALFHDDAPLGYIVYRHADEPRWRTTIVVDYLADPDDPSQLAALLRWVDGEAASVGSEAIRVFATHAKFIDGFRHAGYRMRRGAMRFVAKVNATSVPATFYDSTVDWHVTVGDSDCDR